MLNFKAIGKRIKNARKNKGLTQEKLAEIVDITTEYQSHIETGAARPSWILLENFSSVLGVDESELLFGTPSEKEDCKALIDKISALDLKKRIAAERIIDEISNL